MCYIEIKNKRIKELAFNAPKENVHQTLQQFAEAWYSGDYSSVESMIHSKCKSYLRADELNIAKEVNILKLIENGSGSKTPREVKNREISIYEVRDNQTAIARLMFRDQIHYLNLVNDKGSWKIISDLITPKKGHS